MLRAVLVVFKLEASSHSFIATERFMFILKSPLFTKLLSINFATFNGIVHIVANYFPSSLTLCRDFFPSNLFCGFHDLSLRPKRYCSPNETIAFFTALRYALF
jgi:hypothetical protein